MNGRGQRLTSQRSKGLARLFRNVEQVTRNELRQLWQDRAAGLNQQFDILSRTSGNNTNAAGLGPDNNLNPFFTVTVDNVELICRPGRERHGIRIPVIDPYYALICDFANASQNPQRQLRGTIPYCAHLIRRFHRRNEPNRVLWATQASADLLALGYTLPVFRNIHYVFFNICVENNNIRHAMLLIISPEAKTLEVLDSSMRSHHAETRRNLYNDYFRLLNVHYGRDFIPYEWRMREGHCVRQGRYGTCVLHSTTNAMCYAFGYDNMKIPARDPLDNRRSLFARELWNGSFDPTPGSRFNYPVLPTELDNASINGWRPLSTVVMASLPIEARARRGKYSGPEWGTKASVTRYCRNNRRRYGGYSAWSGRPLAEYIEQVEIRDYNIRRRVYQMPPPP